MSFSQLLLVINIGLIASIVNVLHVIIGYARTLPGQVYMATGHYYLDYFEYLQALSQGWHGHWIYKNYYGTDIKFKTLFGMWQNLLIGHAGKFFGLSQVVSYWLSIIFFSIILSLLIFFVIRKILIDRPFYWQFGAFILTLAATPFFELSILNGRLNIIPFRFWNDRAILLDRFSSIPYRLTEQITVLIIILLLSKTIDRLDTDSKRILFFRTIVLIALFAFLITFSPAYFVLGVCALGISLIWLIISKQSFVKIKYLVFIIGILIPLGWLTKVLFIDKIFGGISQFETGWQVHPPSLDIALTTGPILLFVLFGLKSYFSKISSIKLIIMSFVLSSYLFFLSPIAQYLGTTNARFLSPINYIILGVLAVSGIKKKKYLAMISVIFVILFIPSAIKEINNKINDRNLSSPISYLSKGIINGFEYLKRFPGQDAVLTTPSQFIGTIIPIYSDKPVYISRPGQFGYYEKADLSAKFYWNSFSELEAKQFLDKNQIGFVVLTSIEGYPPDNLKKYKFLKKIYHNKDIVVYQKI